MRGQPFRIEFPTGCSNCEVLRERFEYIISNITIDFAPVVEGPSISQSFRRRTAAQDVSDLDEPAEPDKPTQLTVHHQISNVVLDSSMATPTNGFNLPAGCLRDGTRVVLFSKTWLQIWIGGNLGNQFKGQRVRVSLS
jgi:hypothetical protein